MTGYVADALFNSLNTDAFVFGFQASRHDVVLRRELYSVGALVVSYDYTNSTERELRLWPRHVAGHLRSQLEEEADALRSQGWNVIRFVPMDQLLANQQSDLNP